MFFLDWVKSDAAAPFFAGDYGTQPFYPQANWPAAIYHAGSDKTYISWETETLPNSVKVAEYDHATSTITQIVTVDSHKLEDDNHGMPVLEVLSDGRLVCFYGAHNGVQNNLEWSISDQSGGNPDISNWTRQTALSGMEYTYPKPINVDSGGGAGTLYLIARDRTVTSPATLSLAIQSASYTSGGAVSFGAVAELFDADNSSAGGRVYAAEFYLDGSDNIEIACTYADAADTARQHVYFLRYITATGALENFSGGTSTAAGSLPISLATANASYRIKDSGSNYTGFVSFCRDSNGYAHLLYGDGNTDPIDVKHQFHNGISWSSETTLFTARDAGALFGTTAGGSTTLWCLVPGASGTVQAWYGDGNVGSWSTTATDTTKRRIWNGSTWGSAQTMLPADTFANGLMTSVRFGDPDLRVFASNHADSVTDADREFVKKYIYGDSGFLDWGVPVNDSNIYQVCLLLNFNGSDAATTTTDDSSWGHIHPVTFNGTAQLDTAQKKFGTASCLFGGNASGDYLTVPLSRAGGVISSGSEFKVSSGDTIEFFVRFNSINRIQGLISTRRTIATVNSGFQIQINAANVFKFFMYNTSGTLMFDLASTTTATTGVWYYVVAKRVGSTYTLWIDGTQEASATNATAPGEANTLLTIGNDNEFRASASTGRELDGHIDSIRWTKGVGRDVSTVPTSEFPSD